MSKPTIEFLERIELFKGLTSSELNTIRDHITYEQFKEGDRLFIEGAKRENIFIIGDGEIELYKKTPYGAEKRLSIFNKYDFLGEGSLTDDAPHSTSARALRSSEVFVLYKDVFKTHGGISLKIFSNIAKVISRRMKHSNTRTINSTAQYESGQTRTEHDLLGDREVPSESYYGIQTMRARENFNITGVLMNFYPVFIRSFAMVKKAAAHANFECNILDKEIMQAIDQACDEIINNKFHYHFIVDMVQGGAGTSVNMNANEVIANRALEILGHKKGEYQYCHPNNHVNLSQSTNDAYPTSVKVAIMLNNKKLVRDLKNLIQSFKKKAKEFEKIIKMGRTQLQDAVPMTLGQSFNAFAVTLEDEVKILETNSDLFLEINMGGTAIGTKINTPPEYCNKVVKHMQRVTGLNVELAEDLVEETSDTGGFVMYSAALKHLSVKLSKICNDLRLLSSGPRAGLNEINLPAMQPGSSIMPGKVNPVIPEVVNQIAFKVIGNDLAVTMASEAGQLELNVMEPVMVHCIFESVEMLKNGMNTLRIRCIDGITANEKVCRNFVDRSIGIVTALNPVLGYEVCTSIAKEALETDKNVAELVLEKKLMSKEKLDEILSPDNMIK